MPAQKMLRKSLTLKIPNINTNSDSVLPRTPKASPEVEMCQIPVHGLPLSFLHLGSFADLQDQSALRAYGITHVLSLHWDGKALSPDRVTHKQVLFQDSSEANIADYLLPCFDFIEQARLAGGCILVHCYRGISRAPSVVIAYLMMYHKYNWEQAHGHVLKHRPIISPNLTFREFLSAPAHEGGYQQYINIVWAFMGMLLTLCAHQPSRGSYKMPAQAPSVVLPAPAQLRLRLDLG
uniref:protein-tyrosine-phosphatase n=1 Tax=Eutreptiella gymnastica TaxID=73025 RepID=A0A7S1J2B1_9EUGL|mmetsp:Transcript_60604/g.108098  ORF Transcript_60604/g.108098 Transcript_60604/m.108098 type:complete len:236 (+) Transcript_60604:28-735(+)